MKRLLLLAASLLSLTAMAQPAKYASAQELRGSGRTLRQVPSVKLFDALVIRQFPARVQVEVGGTEPSVDITLDDNLLPLLRVDSQNGTLTLSFKDSQGRPFWISKASIDVRITTPTLKRLQHGSNSDVTVKGLQGNAFLLVNEANGQVTLQGQVATLDILSSANGTVDAEALPVQSAKVVTEANATIRIHAQHAEVVRQAFATIINVADQSRTLARDETSPIKATPKLVHLRFQNNSPQHRQITLISYAPGEAGNETNGFTLTPFAHREKQYPVGTAVYVATHEQVDQVMQGGRLTGKPFLTVNPQDEGRTVKLFK